MKLTIVVQTGRFELLADHILSLPHYFRVSLQHSLLYVNSAIFCFIRKILDLHKTANPLSNQTLKSYKFPHFLEYFYLPHCVPTQTYESELRTLIRFLHY